MTQRNRRVNLRVCESKYKSIPLSGQENLLKCIGRFLVTKYRMTVGTVVFNDPSTVAIKILEKSFFFF